MRAGKGEAFILYARFYKNKKEESFPDSAADWVQEYVLLC